MYKSVMPSLHFVAVAHCIGLMKPNAAGAKSVPAHNACMVKCTTFDRSQLDLVTTGCLFVTSYSFVFSEMGWRIIILFMEPRVACCLFDMTAVLWE